jgi:hypothetical protein
LREEHRLWVFENRVLRRVFGDKRYEVTGECRKLHNEEPNDLYSSPSIVRVVNSRQIRLAGHVANKAERRVVYRVLDGNSRRKRPLGRPRRRWENNIKIVLQEAGCGGMDWIKLAQDRNKWRVRLNALIKLQVP